MSIPLNTHPGRRVFVKYTLGGKNDWEYRTRTCGGDQCGACCWKYCIINSIYNLYVITHKNIRFEEEKNHRRSPIFWYWLLFIPIFIKILFSGRLHNKQVSKQIQFPRVELWAFILSQQVNGVSVTGVEDWAFRKRCPIHKRPCGASADTWGSGYWVEYKTKNTCAFPVPQGSRGSMMWMTDEGNVETSEIVRSLLFFGRRSFQ